MGCQNSSGLPDTLYKELQGNRKTAVTLCSSQPKGKRLLRLLLDPPREGPWRRQGGRGQVGRSHGNRLPTPKGPFIDDISKILAFSPPLLSASHSTYQYECPLNWPPQCGHLIWMVPSKMQTHPTPRILGPGRMHACPFPLKSKLLLAAISPRG